MFDRENVLPLPHSKHYEAIGSYNMSFGIILYFIAIYFKTIFIVIGKLHDNALDNTYQDYTRLVLHLKKRASEIHLPPKNICCCLKQYFII